MLVLCIIMLIHYCIGITVNSAKHVQILNTIFFKEVYFNRRKIVGKRR